jgi:hypothetical protein
VTVCVANAASPTVCSTGGDVRCTSQIVNYKVLKWNVMVYCVSEVVVVPLVRVIVHHGATLHYDNVVTKLWPQHHDRSS